MTKKLDEIKGAISANSTPIKSAGPLDRSHRSEDDLEVDHTSRSRRVSSEMDLWGRLSDSRKSSCNNLLFLGEHHMRNFTNHTYPTMPDNIHPQVQLESHRKNNNTSADIDIQLTSCSPCHNCEAQMFDQDIMAGWSAEDSNLNTMCHKCKKQTVPFLNIQITMTQKKEKETTRMSVPYLNPLVLRKELENILGQYGDDLLCKTNFVDKHTIIYWNLIWFMERIAVQTHLPSLFFTKSVSLEFHLRMMNDV